MVTSPLERIVHEKSVCLRLCLCRAHHGFHDMMHLRVLTCSLGEDASLPPALTDCCDKVLVPIYIFRWRVQSTLYFPGLQPGQCSYLHHLLEF